jgi:hypothetical protein
MGGGQSVQVQYVVNEDPYPGGEGASGLSLSQAEKCNACRLGVNTKITTSNVKLKRQVGSISPDECRRYAEDWNRVNKSLSVPDFLAKLQTGRYSKLISENTTGDQYCQELSISDEDAAAMRESGNLDQSKFKGGRIRKVSGSSFSEESKAKYVLSIPFEMFFAAKKAAVDANGRFVYQDVSETFKVTQVTLYHPAPIRIDSVQADAMLSLNDPTDPGAKYIVLIPLRAVNSGAPSIEFLNKIAGQLVSIKEPRPDTGEYQEVTIPTGAEWGLDKLFTLTGEVGSSTVKNGFFTWTGVSGYERVNKGTRWEGSKFITDIGWKQTEGLSSPQYILLDTPLDMSSESLTNLTLALPATDASEALHPVPVQTNLVYHKASEPPAPDTVSGKGACGLGNICEGFGLGDIDPTFLNNCPNAKCDPFLQNAVAISNGENLGWFTPERVFGLIIGFFSLIAMLLGAYLALLLIRDDYDVTLQRYSEKLGKIGAIFYFNLFGTKTPAPAASGSNAGPSLLDDAAGALSGAKLPGGLGSFFKRR